MALKSPDPTILIKYNNTEEKLELGSQDTVVVEVEEDTKSNALNAFLFTVLSSFFNSLTKLAVKTISRSSEKLPTFQIIFLRSCMLFLFCVAAQIYNLLYYKKRSHFFGHPSARYLLSLLGVLGCTAIAFGFWALQHLNIGEFTALTFISPVFIGFLSLTVLKEYLSLVDILGSLLSIIGVIFIAQPPTIFPGSSSKESPYHTYGVLAALFASFCGACAKITMRKLGTSVSPIQATSYVSLITIVFSLAFFPWTNTIEPWKLPKQGSTYGLIIEIGITGFIGQILLSKALQIETAIKVVTYSFIQVLISFLLEGLAFGSIPSKWSLIGSAIIGASVVGTAIFKYSEIKRKKLENNIKELEIKKIEVSQTTTESPEFSSNK